MLPNKLLAITNLINQAKDQTIAPITAPQIPDLILNDLFQNMLQLELQQEVDFLSNAIKNQQTFRQELKARCLWRATHPYEAISFAEVAESSINKLYWQICMLAFEPETMQQMLKIIAPNLQSQVIIDLPLPTFTNNISESTGGEQPKLTLSLSDNLYELSEPPSYEKLSDYAISGNMLFDVSLIQNYTIYIHAQLQKLLKTQLPDLEKRIYKHNLSFIKLAIDINNLNNSNVTCNDMIEELATGLDQKIYSESHAKAACKRFMNFFSSLPEPMQANLKTLHAGNENLGGLIDNVISKGEYRGTTVTTLMHILNANSNAAVLKKQTKISQEELEELEKQYRRPITDTKKIPHILYSHSETSLMHQIFKKIPPVSPDDLSKLLQLYPSVFYSILLKVIAMENPEASLELLVKQISANQYSSQQNKILVDAIFSNYSRFNQDKSLLCWVVGIDNSFFLEEYLKHCTDEELIESVESMLTNSQSSFNELIKRPKHLSTILTRFPKDKLIHVLDAIDDAGNLPLYLAAGNSESLGLLLSTYPPESRLVALNASESGQDSTLYRASFHPNSLKVILDLLPENDIFTLLKTQIHKKNVLEILVDMKILTAQIDLKYSFLPDFIALYTLIKNETKQSNTNEGLINLFGFYRPNNELVELHEDIDKAKTFDEIKVLLTTYAEQNNYTPIAKEIMKRIGINPQNTLSL
ncbi:MAG: hypothetical protein WC627_11825 [Legionella sp.]|jgi:hypothetical protein